MRRGWISILVGASLSLVALRACSMSGAPINGVVIEKETGRPLQGAVVVVTWNGIYGLMHSQSTCYHVETTRAGTDGKFHINGWSDGATMMGVFINDRGVFMDAFKPGFTDDPDPGLTQNKIFLSRSTRSKEEYFLYLRRLVSGNICPDGGGSRKNLYRLYAAVASEAQKIAETSQQKEISENLGYVRESVLVNEGKPMEQSDKGYFINTNPGDSYQKEDLLK